MLSVSAQNPFSRFARVPNLPASFRYHAQMEGVRITIVSTYQPVLITCLLKEKISIFQCGGAGDTYVPFTQYHHQKI